MDRKMTGYGGCVHPWVGQFGRRKDGKVEVGRGGWVRGVCVWVRGWLVGGWGACLTPASLAASIKHDIVKSERDMFQVKPKCWYQIIAIEPYCSPVCFRETRKS